jgi:hypothetical protein
LRPLKSAAERVNNFPGREPVKTRPAETFRDDKLDFTAGGFLIDFYSLNQFR